MEPNNYTIRCDKHQFKPFEYCEICWLRTRISNIESDARRAMQSAVGDLYICIAEFQDFMALTRQRLKKLEGEPNA
jgi:hypothetical protein